MNVPEQEPAPLLPVKILFDRDSGFRIYHADGTWGGVNNTGNIQLNFFLEHDVLPSTLIHPLAKDGTLNPHGTIGSEKDEHTGFFTVRRTFQTAVVFNVAAARNLAGLLNAMIKISEDTTSGKETNAPQ